MSRDFLAQDSNLSTAGALPAGGASSATTSLDLQTDSTGSFVIPCEFIANLPALTSTALPNGQTISYSVQHAPDNATWTTLIPEVAVQTGTGSAILASAPTFRVPPTVNRYIRLLATASASAASSGVTFSLGMAF